MSKEANSPSDNILDVEAGVTGGSGCSWFDIPWVFSSLCLFIPGTVSNGYDLYLKINNTLKKTVQVNYFALSKVKFYEDLFKQNASLLPFMFLISFCPSFAFSNVPAVR